jgi:hypothetical protein
MAKLQLKINLTLKLKQGDWGSLFTDFQDFKNIFSGDLETKQPDITQLTEISQ